MSALSGLVGGQRREEKAMQSLLGTTRPRGNRKVRTEMRSDLPLELFGVRRRTIVAMTAVCVGFALFILVPIVWIVINSTKTQSNIFHSFGFWFARPFSLFHNLSLLFQPLDIGESYATWLENSAIYATLAGIGATALSGLAGYGFARFKFRGSKVMFAALISVLLVPIAAISFPLYLVYAKVGLLNSIWGMVLPSMVSPVGMYLMKTYVDAAVPRELMEAARIDGAGELQIFVRVGLPLMVPGLVTVLLLSVVAVWNNYFLPLIIFSQSSRYPLTVGLGILAAQANGVNNGPTPLTALVVVGALVAILPMMILFTVLQRYWRGGLLTGSVTG